MNFRELAEQVKAGTVLMESCDHKIGDFKQRFLLNYEKLLANAAGAMDGKWQGGIDDARMRAHFNMKLDFPVFFNEILFDYEPESCRGCGENVRWIFDGEKLILCCYWVGEDGVSRGRGDFAFRPDHRCSYSSRPTEGEIAVTSPLVFANFFRCIPDSPDDSKHSEAWSLNNVRGRENITRYKAGRNVAYGQMSNMSVGIFLHPDKKSIIVGDPWSKGDRDRRTIKGHKRVGRIVLDVWRWEATDVSTLMAAAGDQYESLKKDRKASGWVELDVPHGIWQFTHYFNPENGEDSDDLIYSRLVLK